MSLIQNNAVVVVATAPHARLGRVIGTDGRKAIVSLMSRTPGNMFAGVAEYGVEELRPATAEELRPYQARAHWRDLGGAGRARRELVPVGAEEEEGERWDGMA